MMDNSKFDNKRNSNNEFDDNPDKYEKSGLNHKKINKRMMKFNSSKSFSSSSSSSSLMSSDSSLTSSSCDATASFIIDSYALKSKQIKDLKRDIDCKQSKIEKVNKEMLDVKADIGHLEEYLDFLSKKNTKLQKLLDNDIQALEKAKKSKQEEREKNKRIKEA